MYTITSQIQRGFEESGRSRRGTGTAVGRVAYSPARICFFHSSSVSVRGCSVSNSWYLTMFQTSSSVSTLLCCLAAILRQHLIEDVSVEDPPLEEVIADMFSQVNELAGTPA